MIDPAELTAALAGVVGAAGRHAAPRVSDGRVSLILDVTGLDANAQADLQAEVERALRAVASVTEVRIALTSERRGRRLIAVASGKGGVGKSTLAANLAIALQRGGLNVGLVDADIYGPSQPRLLASEGERPTSRNGSLVPVVSRHGIPMLSVGHLVEPGRAVAWRGPMAAKALDQLIDADWGDARVLIVDVPPGTGDVQLSMIAKHKPAGAVIVSTPQDLALIDATRAIDLFEQGSVPIIGLVENMSGYACPSCGVVSEPFGHGGAEAAARAMGQKFLGRIPLDSAIRAGSDAGEPPAAGNGAQSAAFHQIAAHVRAWLGDA